MGRILYPVSRIPLSKCTSYYGSFLSNKSARSAQSADE